MTNSFKVIDLNSWDRKDIYVDYLKCRYYITVKIDITHLVNEIKGKYKFYPTINYCIAKVMNEHEEFRYTHKDGIIKNWEKVHPLYTLLRKNNLFTHKCTEYVNDFDKFYENFLEDKNLAENCNRLYYDDNLPENLVCTSTMPDLTFDSLSFTYPEESESLIPFITVGKYFEDKGKILLPVAGEFHHAVNDGIHAQTFFKELEKVCGEFKGSKI